MSIATSNNEATAMPMRLLQQKKEKKLCLRDTIEQWSNPNGSSKKWNDYVVFFFKEKWLCCY